jgi:hypothetical protein
MEHALQHEDSPLDANLEKVLPGMHQWHQANESAMTQLKTGVDTLGNKLESGLSQLAEFMKEGQVGSEERLAETFMDIANIIMARRGLKRSSHSAFALSPSGSFEEKQENTENDSPAVVVRHVRRKTNAGKFTVQFSRPTTEPAWFFTGLSF